MLRVATLWISIWQTLAWGAIQAGVGKADLAPPLGTPLAGYGARLGGPSTGIHDPVEARALVLAVGTEKIALVAVDHLGFDHAMVARVRSLASVESKIPEERVFVISSHTNAGGGAYLEIFPELAGKYDPGVRSFYEQRAAAAVVAAAAKVRPARVGFGSGALPGLSRYRSKWPPDTMPDARPVDPELGVLRVDDAATGHPMAVLMNFAAHPTVLGADNFQFSSDFVGYARTTVERLLGGGAMALFANGAEGTISPRPFLGKTGWERAENMGAILGAETFKVVHMIETRDDAQVKFARAPLQLKPQMPPLIPPGRTLGETYSSEMAALSFDGRVALVTIPGELSSILNRQVKERGRQFGFEKTWLLGITNDAVGYIVTEDEYRHQTYEASVSFFGPHFGSVVVNEAFQLLEKLRK